MSTSRSFGIYVHVPYCIQRCLYCDFATYEQSQIFPPQEYIEILLEEMRQKSNYFTPQDVDTLYFGGGTPSLIEPGLLEKVILGLKQLGFSLKPHSEVTLEINPATISLEKMRQYMEIGINRYSVGAQTFNNSMLKRLGREHNSAQTLETLTILRDHCRNFNFDILFALPNQGLSDLQSDIVLALEQEAPHISPYCLTIPKGHVLSRGRAPDEEQVEMFELIRKELVRRGYNRYEISNFSKPGFESKHNLLYWRDQEYWGLGLSAHSYSKKSAWGTRFWNVSSINEYKHQILGRLGQSFDDIATSLPSDQLEDLAEHQSLTDFCHTSLRLSSGLSESALNNKFGRRFTTVVQSRLEKLSRRGLVHVGGSSPDSTWTLTEKGVLISNLVFEEMTYLSDDLRV